MRTSILTLALLLAACGGGGGETQPPVIGDPPSGGGGGSTDSGSGGGSTGSGGAVVWNDTYPAAGNPAGACAVPAEAAAEDASKPTQVIGDGTPASCTGAAVVAAVAKGGVISFNCGADPVTITMTQPARIFNNTGPKIVIDGGNKVTLSGGGKSRILYMNTCDPDLVWTTPHCQDQDHPQVSVQNISFIDGNASGLTPYDGGGAIWARGGRLKLVNTRFFRNQCDATGPDVGGAAVRAFSQSQNKPLYVVNSTFGGADGLGNMCSNGGGLSSIGVSYSVINSLFSHNKAIGNGANPARSGTPGGGSGGAIYNDGNTFDLALCGTRIANNTANEGGGAIFFVSNDRSGTLSITDSVLSQNPSAGFETAGYPGIFYLGLGAPKVSGSTLSQ
ncbi:hypothetical protein OPU71_02365 [Niveibacterium sp. 24ML]|uniref:hypothetical protein n=1 Tax=Niveibacterium sp. 24ML TaxID=2985512 RepID=UPI00226FF292|nr:hypothetical protein [Niveibacterium sp. 24ML]MCX9154964.1 hypothetical protein [Niveibacterium sp. 24ML]